MNPLWGIDMGGTKIEGAILEERGSNSVLKRLRVPTEGHKGYKHVIEQIAKLVEVLTAETGLKPGHIGIGTPGVLDPITKKMKNCNLTALNGMPLKKDLEARLSMPVNMANDANCFAMAETTVGVVNESMPDAKVVFGVIMGTGVGGGLVVNGKIIGGRQGIGGEWGHNFLHESGGDCYCGKVGCVETVLSGPALERYYESVMGIPKPLKEIVTLAHNGTDEVAVKTMQRLVHYFGKAMSMVINIVDPDAIVLGGGLGNIDLLYTKGIEEVEKHVFNNRLDTIFLRPMLGDSAGVFGAALL